MKCRRSNNSRGSRLRGPANRAVAENPASGAHFSPPPPLTHSSVSAMPESASVLHIDGHTEGSIQYGGTVSVGPHGAVVGDIRAAAVIVEGAVKGHIHATQTLRIAGSATIVGDMHAPRVAVARGAQLRGNIRMRTDPAPPSDLDEPAVDTLLSGGRRA
jgi:cytoskeletal protein CcmA (bactofilin family)